MILIDTDMLIEILDKHSDLGDKASKKVMASGERFCTSAVNLHEILYGYIKRAELVDKSLLIPVLEYTKTDAILSSRLEAEIEEKSDAKLRLDSMIAAVAINNHCKLLTNNHKDFNQFKGLEFF